MYSGNAGITSPLDTLLSAAAQLRRSPHTVRIYWRRHRKKKLDEMLAKEKPTNIVCLPYQPLDQIRYSLSAADIHVVSIADVAGGCGPSVQNLWRYGFGQARAGSWARPVPCRRNHRAVTTVGGSALMASLRASPACFVTLPGGTRAGCLPSEPGAARWQTTIFRIHGSWTRCAHVFR